MPITPSKIVEKSDKFIKTKNQKISICDVMKTDSSRIIKKLESQIPLNFQESSILYTAYLQTMDHIFGTCLIAEKEFFDKLNIDQELLSSYQKYSNFLADAYVKQIENYSKFRQTNIQIQMSLLESYDEFFKTMVDSYGKFLSHLNKVLDPSISK